MGVQLLANLVHPSYHKNSTGTLTPLHNNFYHFFTYNVIIISQISKEVKSIYRADLWLVIIHDVIVLTPLSFIGANKYNIFIILIKQLKFKKNSWRFKN